MGIEFREKEPTGELKPQKIMLDGRQIGECEPAKYDHCDQMRWHCSIGGSRWGGPLLQGFSPSMEQSLTQAVLDGFKEHVAAVEWIRELAAKLEIELPSTTPAAAVA